MAKKKIASKKKKVAPKKVITFTIEPSATAQHLDHQVHAQLEGKACRIGGGPGVSNKEYAFNLAPGFQFRVRHTRRADKRCELVIKQGPYVGTTSAKQSRLALVPFPSVCMGLDCEITPCPENLPVPDCVANACVATFMSVPGPGKAK